jgi:hypothetical protein
MRTEVKYGVITGIAVCSWVVIEYLLGFHTSRLEIGKYSGYFSMIIPFVTLFLAIREKLNETEEESLSVWQGIRTGVLVSFLSAVITAVFMLLYNNLINPGWQRAAMEMQKRQMMQGGMSLEAVNKYMKDYEIFMSGPIQFTLIIVGTVASGFVLSLILCLILKVWNRPLTVY